LICNVELGGKYCKKFVDKDALKADIRVVSEEVVEASIWRSRRPMRSFSRNIEA
jgi:hypothetical protein